MAILVVSCVCRLVGRVAHIAAPLGQLIPGPEEASEVSEHLHGTSLLPRLTTGALGVVLLSVSSLNL